LLLFDDVVFFGQNTDAEKQKQDLISSIDIQTTINDKFCNEFQY
jgi:hypothetical protein